MSITRSIVAALGVLLLSGTALANSMSSPGEVGETQLAFCTGLEGAELEVCETVYGPLETCTDELAVSASSLAAPCAACDNEFETDNEDGICKNTYGQALTDCLNAACQRLVDDQEDTECPASSGACVDLATGDPGTCTYEQEVDVGIADIDGITDDDRCGFFGPHSDGGFNVKVGVLCYYGCVRDADEDEEEVPEVVDAVPVGF